MSNKSYNSIKNGVRARVASSARVFTSPKITRTQYNCRPTTHLLIFSWTEGQKIQKKYAPQKNMILMFLCLNNSTRKGWHFLPMCFPHGKYRGSGCKPRGLEDVTIHRDVN